MKKKILDVTCGCRSIWFDKNHTHALYCDIRKEPKGFIAEGTNYEVNPDRIEDFTNLSFPDRSFKMVIFDPPHLCDLSPNSWIAKKYGTLPKEKIVEIVVKGLQECWRVLDTDGVLIFKWSEEAKSRSISTKKLIELSGLMPIVGHTTGSKSRTKWMSFMKIEGD